MKSIRSLTGKNSGQPDYDDYRMTIPELIVEAGKGAAILALFSYVFYRSVIAFFILLPGLLPFLFYERKKKTVRRKEQLTGQFREMMIAVIASLQAGYSIENAFLRAYEDIRLLYGKGSMIAGELLCMNRELRNNRNIEEVLQEFAIRTHISEITDFAEVFHIAKRSGGDLPAILQNTADLISQKIDVRREIATQISAKKMEQLIMDMVPFGIVLYIDATSPGFFEPLYHNVMGVALMTVLLGVYIAAYLMGQKILDIAY